MLFNVFSAALAWIMSASMTSAVVLALAPTDPAPALVFAASPHNVLGWIVGTMFSVFVYRALSRKDRAITRRAARENSQEKN